MRCKLFLLLCMQGSTQLLLAVSVISRLGWLLVIPLNKKLLMSLSGEKELFGNQPGEPYYILDLHDDLNIKRHLSFPSRYSFDVLFLYGAHI